VLEVDVNPHPCAASHVLWWVLPGCVCWALCCAAGVGVQLIQSPQVRQSWHQTSEKERRVAGGLQDTTIPVHP
jgi:hypothetical protein